MKFDCWVVRSGDTPTCISGLREAVTAAQALVEEDPTRTCGVFFGHSQTSTWWHHGWRTGEYITRLGPVCGCEVCLRLNNR